MRIVVTGCNGMLGQKCIETQPADVELLGIDLQDSDLIFIGSFASEHPRYAEYMGKYAEALYNYVDKGNVLLQMTQADQTESAPPFLPSTHGAKRNDEDFAKAVIVSRDNPLMRGIGSGNIDLITRRFGNRRIRTFRFD